VWPPHPDLAGVVDAAYAVNVGEARYPVVPDGRAAIVWASDGALRVCGPVTRSWRPDRSNVEVTGVRLALGAWPAAFATPAGAVVNQRIDLAELWDDTAELSARLARAGSVPARLTVLQAELRSRRAPVDIDPMVAGLVEHLATGRARISSIAGVLGLSPRQLHRRCCTALGYPPSVLARLARFQHFLAGLDAAGSRPARLADLAVAAGYADQSHLTRDCRTLTGLRPSSLLPPSGRGTSDPFKMAGPTAPTVTPTTDLSEGTAV
jgi:AraC-like DNA-binding protein